MVTSSLHAISFLRTRPASLLLPFTIRRSAQSSSSGLPHRKRTYLPKRTCGNGSSLLVRTRSRTQVSGTLQRTASCLQSMNSYCAANTPLLPASSLFAFETVMVHHPSDSAQNRLPINHEIPTIKNYLRCNACGDSNAVSTPPTRVSQQAPAGSAKRAFPCKLKRPSGSGHCEFEIRRCGERRAVEEGTMFRPFLAGPGRPMSGPHVFGLQNRTADGVSTITSRLDERLRYRKDHKS